MLPSDDIGCGAGPRQDGFRTDARPLADVNPVRHGHNRCSTSAASVVTGSEAANMPTARTPVLYRPPCGPRGALRLARHGVSREIAAMDPIGANS